MHYSPSFPPRLFVPQHLTVCRPSLPPSIIPSRSLPRRPAGDVLTSLCSVACNTRSLSPSLSLPWIKTKLKTFPDSSPSPPSAFLSLALLLFFSLPVVSCRLTHATLIPPHSLFHDSESQINKDIHDEKRVLLMKMIVMIILHHTRFAVGSRSLCAQCKGRWLWPCFLQLIGLRSVQYAFLLHFCSQS